MAATPAQPWTPQSWRSKKVAQDVIYPSETAERLGDVREKLQSLPGLVTSVEIERLRSQLAAVCRGEGFLLQGGDCAELFAYCTHQQVAVRLRLLLMMSLILVWGARVPVVRVGRLAGQYAKPRSKPTEIIDGVEHTSFRGDNVNGFPLNERTPDPNRMLMAYFHSAATINHIRALIGSGFADLHAPAAWSFAHVRSPELQRHFEEIVERLEDSLNFMKTIGASAETAPGSGPGPLEAVDLWTSHECLLLEYEAALTRSDESQTGSTHHYDLSAHMVWVGDRTRQLDGAHLEFLRGIRNPLGVKVGPTMQTDELVDVLRLVNPGNEEGRVTLICRYGAGKVEECLPKHIEAVRQSGCKVIWACDPMHGNTRNAEGLPGVKTRHLADIVTELATSIKLHTSLKSRLGGVHLEMTGDVDDSGFSVTECIGGSMNLASSDLGLRYQTYCDPRLNYEQSLDIAFLVADYLKSLRKGQRTEDAIMSNLARRA